MDRPDNWSDAASLLRSTVRRRGLHVVDPIRSVDRAVYVTGSARSGTTWIAERLAARRTSRLVFEPLHHRSRLGRMGKVPHIETGAGSVELREFIRSTLDGRCRDPWVNSFQHAAITLRRVVKDIRPGVLPVVCSVAPTVPVVVVVRDPIATAQSRHRLEAGRNWFATERALDELRTHARRDDRLGELARWANDLADGPLGAEPLTRLVALWCVENSVAIDAARAATTALVVRYEDVVNDPQRWMTTIGAATGVRPADMGDLTSPSSTTFRSPTPNSPTASPPAGVESSLDEAIESELRVAVSVWLPDFAGLGAETTG